MSTQTYKIGAPLADDLQGQKKDPDSIWVMPFNFELISLGKDGMAMVAAKGHPAHPVDARRLVPSVSLASELVRKINGTNNGYLFAPTGQEVNAAKYWPQIFEVKEFTGEFKFKISLK